MEKKMIGVNFDLRFEEIKDVNPSFAIARVAIAYAGRNRNYSAITKEVFEAALPSLLNCPLVGRYDADSDDFGSHDIRVVRNSDGELCIQNATVPFGTVPESSRFEWATITEADGTQREYLFCDVVLWKRQYGYECLAKQDSWHQSMEISVDSYVVDHDGYCNIEKMSFEALCILGNGVEPCFESASVQMKSDEAVSNYRTQFSKMMKELRESDEFKTFNFDFKQIEEKKEVKNDLKFTEQVRDSILAEYGFSLDGLSFEITEDMDEEKFRAALDQMNAAAEKQKEFSCTYKQKREALENALDPIVVRNSEGDIISQTYYWVADFDDTHVFVERYIYTDTDSTDDYGRFQYGFDDATMTASIDGDFEPMILQWLTIEENEKLEQSRNAFEVLKQDFESYKQTHSTENTAVDELVQFKKQRLGADHNAEIDAVLAEFEDIGESEEFIALTGENKAYAFEDVEVLRKECFAIRGKSVSVKFEKQNKKNVVKVPISGAEKAPSRYGDLFERY